MIQQTMRTGLALQQKLSPAQVQFLKLLQLPIISLEQAIRDELNENPLLEEGEVIEEAQTPSMDQDNDIYDMGSDGDGEATTPVERRDVEDFIEQDIREHRSDEYSWEEFLENNEGSHSKNWYDNEDEDYELPMPSAVTMRESLFEQLGMTGITDVQRIIADEILGSLDEDGYLRRDLIEIVAVVNYDHQLSVTVEDVELVLKKIQRLDPPGVAARNLQECLLVQLELQPNTSTARIIALRILRECFEALTHMKFDRIMRTLHIDETMMRKAFGVITRLNPKPGEGNISTAMNYVVPDIFLHRDRGEFVIVLNERGVPPLRVNSTYREMTHDTSLSSDTRKYLTRKYTEAKLFIDSIEQRRRTVLAVMQAIVVRQYDFMDKGPGHLKPMIYKDIAEMVNVDISTISRVANGKYVQTEWGVFQLKEFFSEGIATADGDEVSNKEVKSIIRTIIEAEDPKAPLSDEAIQNILNDRGFRIARRTVAKYREALQIPVMRLRKRL